jgi:hypothetical protein
MSAARCWRIDRHSAAWFDAIIPDSGLADHPNCDLDGDFAHLSAPPPQQ